VVRENREPEFLPLIEHIHPVDDHVVLDFVPSLKVGVPMAAAADVEGGIPVDDLLGERSREVRLESSAPVVVGPAPLSAAILRFDVPRIADPGVLWVGKARREVDSALPLGQCDG
jgi:hypothetical protein